MALLGERRPEGQAGGMHRPPAPEWWQLTQQTRGDSDHRREADGGTQVPRWAPSQGPGRQSQVPVAELNKLPITTP